MNYKSENESYDINRSRTFLKKMLSNILLGDNHIIDTSCEKLKFIYSLELSFGTCPQVWVTKWESNQK